MAIAWDLTKITDYKDVCFIENVWPPASDRNSKVSREKGEIDNRPVSMNPVTEVLIFATVFVHMGNITEKTYKEFHTRLKEFEVATGGKGLLQMKIDGHPQFRMPTLKEIKSHVGLSTNVILKDKRKWGNEIKRLVKETAQQNITDEREATAVLA